MIAGSASGSSGGCGRSFAFLLAVIFSVVSCYSYSSMVKRDVFFFFQLMVGVHERVVDE